MIQIELTIRLEGSVILPILERWVLGGVLPQIAEKRSGDYKSQSSFKEFRLPAFSLLFVYLTLIPKGKKIFRTSTMTLFNFHLTII